MTAPCKKHKILVKNILGYRHYWLSQLGFWCFAGFVLALGAYTSDPNQSPIDLLISPLLFSLLGLPLSHLLRFCLQALRKRTQSLGAILFASSVFCLLIGNAALNALTAALYLLLGEAWVAQQEVGDFTLRNYFSATLFFASLFAFWTVCYLTARYFRDFRKEKAERQRLDGVAREAELRVLKYQIQPHFLFNCLTTLRALLPEEQRSGREAVTLLADLVRSALLLSDAPEIKLSQELPVISSYLTLEQLRFGSRLQVETRFSPAALACRLPPFILQGLVENAVKHGVALQAQGGTLFLEATLEQGHLELRVRNPGSLARGGEGTGLGLHNMRARLRHLYGPAASLDLVEPEEGLVEARLSLPQTRAVPQKD